MEIFDTVTNLTGCEDIVLLNYYKTMVCDDIKNYLNRDFDDEFIEEKFEIAVIRLMVKKIKQGAAGRQIKSYKQGERSVTYEDSIDDDIKTILPKPYLKLK